MRVFHPSSRMWRLTWEINKHKPSLTHDANLNQQSLIGSPLNSTVQYNHLLSNLQTCRWLAQTKGERVGTWQQIATHSGAVATSAKSLDTCATLNNQRDASSGRSQPERRLRRALALETRRKVRDGRGERCVRLAKWREDSIHSPESPLKSRFVWSAERLEPVRVLPPASRDETNLYR